MSIIKTAAIAVATAATVGAYAYRENISVALIPLVVRNHSVIANCVFDGTVSVIGNPRYCEGNTFNSTGLAIRGSL